MAVADIAQLVKKLTTKTDENPSDSPLATAFNGVSELQGEAKMEFIKNKIVELAKSEGYGNVTLDDVQKYFDGMVSQYEINPMVASMMDMYCSTTCHFGTAIGKN
jgi:hypothetical protein